MGAVVSRLGRRLRRAVRRRRDGAPGERGAVLLQSLLLTGVISLIIGGLATYAVTGLRGARSSGDILRATATSRIGLDLSVEQFANDRWAPCATLTALQVPSDLPVPGDTLTLTCNPAGTLDGHPVIVVAAQGTAGSSTVTYLARLQVSADGTGVAVLGVQRT